MLRFLGRDTFSRVLGWPMILATALAAVGCSSADEDNAADKFSSPKAAERFETIPPPGAR